VRAGLRRGGSEGQCSNAAGMRSASGQLRDELLEYIEGSPIPSGAGLFPLDRTGWLGRVVVSDSVDALHLIDDSGRNAA